MAAELIEKVVSAESECLEKRRAVETESQKKIENARSVAAQIIETAQKEAREAAENNIKAVEVKADELVAVRRNTAASDAEKLRAMAKLKENDCIEAVVSRIIPV